MKFIQIIIPFCILFIISCKPPKQANETSAKPVASTVAPSVAPNTAANDAVIVDNASASEVSLVPVQNMQTSKDTSYRLIVLFVSIGEGTDRDGKKILDSFLNDWKTKLKKEINYETVGWGREGEVDFCFPLHELNEKQQNQFVREIKEKFNGHSLVQFTENEPCLHKR
jgi:hypothetical protein